MAFRTSNHALSGRTSLCAHTCISASTAVLFRVQIHALSTTAINLVGRAAARATRTHLRGRAGRATSAAIVAVRRRVHALPTAINLVGRAAALPGMTHLRFRAHIFAAAAVFSSVKFHARPAAVPLTTGAALSFRTRVCGRCARISAAAAVLAIPGQSHALTAALFLPSRTRRTRRARGAHAVALVAILAQKPRARTPLTGVRGPSGGAVALGFTVRLRRQAAHGISRLGAALGPVIVIERVRITQGPLDILKACHLYLSHFIKWPPPSSKIQNYA